MSGEPPQLPDPEDGVHTVALFWALRASELSCAMMFATALPWAQAFGWFGVIAGIGTLRWWHVTRPSFRDLPRERRKTIYRTYVWILTAFVGSSVYFLYVPSDIAMQAVLAMYLLGTATLLAVRLTGDLLRTALALCMVVLPSSFRFIAEGWGSSTLLTAIGVGGVLMTINIIILSRTQERKVLQQYQQRRHAESVADDAAALALAKSRFFAAVSHDLRQPVHAIGLYVDPLARLAERAGDAAAHQAASGVRQAWRALDDLLSQVLDLTRMDSGAVQAHLQPVDAHAVVRELIMQHSAAAERAGIRLLALVRAGIFVNADELMLKRVLSNLLDNAIKFSPRGGIVAIAARRNGHQWRIEVRDAGIGIPEAEHERVFDEFVQIGNEARDRGRGLGLGLAITRRLTLLMNGSITVRSAPGRGSCISVSLPRASAPGSPIASPRIVAEGDETGAGTSPALPVGSVLLVEDDPLVAQAMCQLLRGWGLVVRHAGDAATAYAEAAFGEAAICDVRLPGGASGLDVALELRARRKKVMLLSGETNEALGDAARAHGLVLLTKPVSPARLLAALRSL